MPLHICARLTLGNGTGCEYRVRTLTINERDLSRFCAAAWSLLQLGHSRRWRYATKPSRGEQPMCVSLNFMLVSPRTTESSDIASSVRRSATCTVYTQIQELNHYNHYYLTTFTCTLPSQEKSHLNGVQSALVHPKQNESPFNFG
jgi:hypothetical protein